MMNSGKGKKFGLISKTWERCKSFSGRADPSPLTRKTRSWSHGLEEPKKARKWSRVAPDGCFSIYVGPEKKRFVIRTEYVNHPLFRVLLEEAESEYGYSSDGPLVLPCDVDRFVEVLMEMDSDESMSIGGTRAGCNFSARSPSSYHMLSPRLVAINYCN